MPFYSNSCHINNHKKWFIVLTAVLAFVMGCIIILNYIIDPFWCFAAINKYNSYAIIIDQRLQKTNKITYDTKSYDTIIIGSSRTEPINQNDFVNYKAFNYAAPAMFPEEYGSYIDYFLKINNDGIDNVFLGLDFFGTIQNKPIVNKSPQSYLETTNAKLYRFKTLLNLDTLRIYAKNYYDHKYYFRYDRKNNILIPKDLSKYNRSTLLSERLLVFQNHFYNNKVYRYDRAYKQKLSELKTKYYSKNIIVFTTPVSQPLYALLIHEGRFEDYCRWIRDVVDVFGGVYNFMYANSITENLENYYDADHFFPRIGTLVAHKITGYPDKNIPCDFGVYVTKDNLEQHLGQLRLQANEIMKRAHADNRTTRR